VVADTERVTSVLLCFFSIVLYGLLAVSSGVSVQPVPCCVLMMCRFFSSKIKNNEIIIIKHFVEHRSAVASDTAKKLVEERYDTQG